MSYTKMMLVPADAAQTPLASQMNKLDVEMNAILSDPTLPMDVKHKLYNQILHKYNFFKTEQSKPLKVEVHERPAQVAKPSLRQAITKLPPTKKATAKRLVELMENAHKLDWNEKKELKYLGDVVPDSNVDEIIDYATRGKTDATPLGWNVFEKWLKDDTVPKSALGNKAAWNKINPPPINLDTPSPTKRVSLGLWEESF